MDMGFCSAPCNEQSGMANDLERSYKSKCASARRCRTVHTGLQAILLQLLTQLVAPKTLGNGVCCTQGALIIVQRADLTCTASHSADTVSPFLRSRTRLRGMPSMLSIMACI